MHARFSIFSLLLALSLLLAAGSSACSGGSAASGSSGGNATTSAGATGGSTGAVAGTTSGGIAGLGSTCNPEPEPDTCYQSFGLECLALPDGTGHCELPAESGYCSDSPGCGGDAGLFCLTGTSSGGTQGSCVYPCTTTDDCQDSLRVCAPDASTHYCAANYCGPLSNPDGGSINGTGFYQPCNVVGSGDGTCYPITNGAATFGLCSQDGTAALGAPCSTVRDGGDTASLCAAGDFCAVGQTTGLCAAACFASGPAGPSCSQGYLCVHTLLDADWGGCLEICGSPSQTCPAGTTCTNEGIYSFCFPN